MAREWGMQPSEFWNLSLTEFWWEFDFNVAKHRKIKPGPKGFSGSEWEAARQIHRKKMNG